MQTSTAKGNILPDHIIQNYEQNFLLKLQEKCSRIKSVRLFRFILQSLVAIWFVFKQMLIVLGPYIHIFYKGSEFCYNLKFSYQPDGVNSQQNSYFVISKVLQRNIY